MMSCKLLCMPLLMLMPICSASDESCIDRCDNGFDATKQCQCDSMCKYYESCCSDYESICDDMTRGDMFPVFPEDEDEDNSTKMSTLPIDRNTNLVPTFPSTIKPLTSAFTTTLAELEANNDLCSKMAFNAFMQLKNGSIYAFRGKYFFELVEKSTEAAHPRLIEDIWGIKGPIDAAFTRINCQGKTYIFKRNQYWRFDNGVLDKDYPRNISVGFLNIPSNLDAAFATPAYNHRGKENVFFFKGDHYFQYEFKHQPSHLECVQMTRNSPSALFRRYTDLYYDRWAQQLYNEFHSHHSSPKSLIKDWIGINAPVDAVMAGRLYVPPRQLLLNEKRQDQQRQWDQWRSQHRARQWNQQQRDRQSLSPSWDDVTDSGTNIGFDFGQSFGQNTWRDHDRQRNSHHRQYDHDYRYNPLKDAHRRQPLQSVYFFQGDQYYRVNLKTKLIDAAFPPYPRSIAKHWLGCSDKVGAEKR